MTSYTIHITVYASSIRTGIYSVFLFLTYSQNWIHRTYQKLFENSINLCGFLCVVALSWSLLLYLLFFSSLKSPLVIVTILTEKKTNFLSTIRIVNGLCTHVICQIKTWIHPILLAEIFFLHSMVDVRDTNDKITTSIDCINSLDC